MTNVYEEYSYQVKPKATELIFRNLLFVVGVLFVYYSFHFYFFLPAAMIIFMFAYYYHRYLKREYEYILINDELQIDKITAKSKRKRLASYDLNMLDSISINHPSFYQKYQDKTYKTKKYNTKSNMDKEYVLMLKKANTYQCIIIQADEKILKGIQTRHLLQFNVKGM